MSSLVRRRIRGMSSVEFAIVGAAVFVLLFAVADLGRLMFLRTMLEEGVRRSARLAAVCPVGDAYARSAAIFDERNWGVRFLPDVTAANVQVQFLNASGAVIADPNANFTQIRFVRVSIVNYVVPVLVPFLPINYTPQDVSSTEPVESLGVTVTEVVPC